MKTFGNFILFAAMGAATIATSGCGWNWTSRGGVKGPPLAKPTPSTNPTDTGGKIIPPTPVIGSYLVAEIRGDDGTPIVNTKVSLMEASKSVILPPAPVALKLWLDSLNESVLYETVSDAEGQINAPIRFILSDVIELKITNGDFALRARVKIPSDVAQAVSQRRVDEGLSQLPNYPAEPSSPESTVPVVELPIDRRLALQLPKNRIEPISADGQNDQEPVLITAFSLPYALTANTKKVGIFPKVVNASVENSFRINWQNAFSESADIRIAYSFSEDVISGWDGRFGDNAGLLSSRSGIDYVTNYESCTDSEYRTSTSGNITSVDDGKCGFIRNQFPFNDGADVFVRLSGESATNIKLSPVFRLVFNNTAPILLPIANKYVVLNTTTIDVPLTLSDSETALVCGTALSAQSSDINILANDAIFIGGVYPECKLTLFPKAGSTGSSDITVTATDGSLVALQQFTVTIKNTPSNLLLSNDTIFENAGTNAVVGNLSATVPDAPDSSFFFSLAAGIGDEDNSSFNISDAKLRANESFDFENKSSYKIRVRTTDVTGAYFEKEFLITVIDTVEDDQFGKVTLLAHMDGADGGTSIFDSSPAQRTLTIYGSGKTNVSNKKFGSASYFSNTLGDRIEAGPIDIKSTDDFTWECWWYPTEFTNGYKAFFGVYSQTGGYSYTFLTNDDLTYRKIFFFKWTNSSWIYTTDGNASLNILLNTWHHVALSRQGSTLRIFFDGVLHQSATFTDALAGNLVIAHHQSQSGSRFGYLDEFRVTVGHARYTSNFTPPNAPFPDGAPPTQSP